MAASSGCRYESQGKGSCVPWHARSRGRRVACLGWLPAAAESWLGKSLEGQHPNMKQMAFAQQTEVSNRKK